MADEEIQYDVKVENAFKNYGGTSAVINGLNMKVQSGTIYGLLGPSGCGKTTLLQCILGTISLDSGCIDLNINCLKDVGYMPQVTCLEDTLTIRETFEFYGALYNMRKKEIESKIHELNTFLELPNLNSYINEISNGQSRRVSLAISMLHDPKIIVLDEPTVGIDPLMRQEIWTQLKKMVQHNKKTIIITTHYIEEANLAETIGLMRNGILVEEGSPQNLLTKYGTDTLEEYFFIVCYNQETNTINVPNKNKARVNTQPKRLTKSKNIRFYRIKALIKKHYFACVRDYMLLYIMILIPIIQSVEFCIGLGVKIRDMSITVKNDEVQVIDRETGELSINISNNIAFLYFPKNFTRDLITYFDDIENYESRSYTILTKENFVVRSQIAIDMMESINYLIKETLKECSKNPRVSGIPMEFNTVYGYQVKSHGNSFTTIFLAMLLYYMPGVMSLSIIMSEKMDGTLNRSMLAGVNLLELVISLFCINAVIAVIQLTSNYFIIFILFSNPIQITNGFFVYMLIMILLGWIGFLSGILVGILTPTKTSGIYIINALAQLQFFLSGVIWPLEGQPRLLRQVSELLPLRFAANTMNNIALKGWTWDHPSTITGITVTSAYIILLILILTVLGILKKNLWVIQN